MAAVPEATSLSSNPLIDSIGRVLPVSLHRRPAAAGIIAVLLLFAMFIADIAHAEKGSGGDATKRLELLRERISELKTELVSMRGARDAQLEKLEKAEKDIGGVTAKLRDLDRKATTANSNMRRLQREHEIETGNLDRTRLTLEKELQLAYMTGKQEQVRLLLNQEDPAALGRLMVYHGYFSRARTQAMQNIRDTLERLAGIERELVVRREEISGLIAQQQEKSAQLLVQQERRRDILARLQKKLSSKTGQLTKLEEDERRLQKLVQSLQQAIREIPPVEREDAPLHTLKGKLHWPVAGRISMHFGEKQFSGKLRARGVHIVSRDGAEIHAIAAGRVVFADWLRGFGLLIIIDHGDQYMSLYGQNSSLYRDVGDRVERDEVIAAAGSSGGQARAGLYLELRKSGRPVNPSAWFKGQPLPLNAAGQASR